MAENVLVPAAPGGSATYKVFPEPDGAVFPAGAAFAWSSSDVTLETVSQPDPDASGITETAQYVAPGTATITASMTDPATGKVLSGTVTETISAPPPPPPPDLTGVSVVRIA